MVAAVSSRVHPDALLILVCILEGFFPIIVKSSTEVFPPLFFLALAAAIASGFHGITTFLQGGLSPAITPRVLIDCLLVSLFIFSGFVLIFIGAKHTTAINTALLLQCEMVTTFLVYEFFFKQKHSLQQLVGAVIVFTGSTLVLYNGSFSLNKGDLIILSSTLCFPFGNYFAKRALGVIPPSQVLLFRFGFAAPIFFVLSFFLEDLSVIFHTVFNHLHLVLPYAICILFLSKFLWYIGLARMSVSRGIFILMAYPAFSLVFAFILLKEVPTWYQVCGFFVAMTGIFILTRTKDSTSAANAV